MSDLTWIDFIKIVGAGVAWFLAFQLPILYINKHYKDQNKGKDN